MPISTIGLLFHHLGLPVTPHPLPPAIHWNRPPALIISVYLLYFSIFQFLLYPSLRLPPSSRRHKVAGWSTIAFVVLFPGIVWGRQKSGSVIVDFSLGVLAFVCSLRIYWMSFIEPTKSAQWTPTQFWSHMVTFPTTSASPSPFPSPSPIDPPTTHAYGYRYLLLTSLPKITLTLLLFRCVPPPTSFASMSFPQQRLYMALLGFILLISLEGFVGGAFAVWGVVTGVKQRGMFRRVWRAEGFRDLWARRWNLPVHGILHVVVFERVSCPCCRVLFGRRRRSSVVRARDDDDDAREKKKKKNEGEKRGACENATAALFTFLLSGIAHEYLTWMSAGHVRGINILYFLLNGLCCTLETWFYKGRRPGWVYRVVFLVGWVWASEVYTWGYVESGFFEEAKVWMRMFGVECEEVVWLFGLPAKWDITDGHHSSTRAH